MKPTGLALVGLVVGNAIAIMLQSIDVTIAAVALPHMQGSLAASQDEINWVITSYIVASAIMTAPAGWMADRFGVKRVVLVSVAGFTLASILTGLSASLFEVVLSRFLQGAFGAALIPLTQAIILNAYEQKDQARGLAWWALGTLLGPMIGPNLGGWITDSWSWRWVFFINIPFGILCFVMIALFVPETKRPKSSFDWFGFAALSLFIGSFQLVMDRGSGQDWFHSREIIIECGFAALGLYSFVVHAMTGSKSFVDFGTLRDRNFAIGTAYAMLLNVVMTASLVLVPSFLQNLIGDPVGLVGSLLTPRSLGMGVVMITVGRVGMPADPRLMTTIGLCCVSYSMWEMANWNLNIGPWEVVLTGVLQGAGLGFAFASMPSVVFAGIPAARRNGATTLYSLARNFGQSIGTSVTTVFLVRNIQINHAEIASHVTPFQGTFLPHLWNWHSLTGRTALDAEVTRQASAIAYFNDFKLLMCASLAIIPAILMIRVVKPAAKRAG